MRGTNRLLTRTIGFTTIFAGLVIAAAGGAQAGERFTPWSLVGADEHMLCLVANVSQVAHTVIIEIRDGGGNPVNPGSGDCIAANPLKLSLDAGEYSFHSCDSAGSRYCHFTVVGAAKSAIRGTMEIRKDSTSAKVLVVPAE